MLMLSLFVFILWIIGVFLLLNLTPKKFSDDMIELISPEENIRRRTEKIQKNKKRNFIVRAIADVHALLTYMNQSSQFSIVCICSIVFAILGIVISIFVNNVYLIVPLAGGFCTLPFIFVRLYSYTYTNQIQRELETTLHTITTSYLRTNDILKSIEENLEYINRPIKHVFQEFVSQIRFINSNERQAIDDMKEKIDNEIFKEWCDGLKQCSQNNTLKYLLVPIVNKFSTLRAIVSSIEEDLRGIRFQYIAVLCIVYTNIPLLYFLNRDWYNVLVNTTQGKFAIGLVTLISVITAIILVFITKPIKYKI